VGAGTYHSCGVQDDGSIACWGENRDGILGNGSWQNTDSPFRVASTAGWDTLSVGGTSACAITDDGARICWGDTGPFGVFNGSWYVNRTELDPAGTWRQFVLGTGTSCGIQENGSLWCTGENSAGQAGQGTSDSPAPLAQIGTDTDWLTVSVGDMTACALKADHSLWCWGVINGVRAPAQIETDTHWQSVSAGGNHACAIRTNGSLWCWGENAYGQVGDGTQDTSTTPRSLGAASDWASVDAGFERTCALKTNGSLWCWGANENGQLGIGSSSNAVTVPTPVSGSGQWQQIDVGQKQGSALCGIQSGGTLWCWGYNTWGQLGIGSHDFKDIPTQVGSEDGWVSAAVSELTSCAQRADDSLWCWGSGEHGQFGDGGLNSTVPKVIAE
jgi:alpha-tubulin suppressor-like RCC1 family protein